MVPLALVGLAAHSFDGFFKQTEPLPIAETSSDTYLTYLEAPQSPSYYAKSPVGVVPKRSTRVTLASAHQVTRASSFSQPLDVILDKIIRCESGYNAAARNPTSSAKGLFQIIDGTWRAFQCEGNVLNAEDNYQCGLKIATQSGLHHWNASRSCWAQQLVTVR